MDYAFSLTNTDQHWAEIVKAMRPQGKIALIDDPKTLDALPLKGKSLSLHWELMFTRSMFETPDMDAQHRMLNEVSKLVDAGSGEDHDRRQFRHDQRGEPEARACGAGERQVDQEDRAGGF